MDSKEKNNIENIKVTKTARDISSRGQAMVFCVGCLITSAILLIVGGKDKKQTDTKDDFATQTKLVQEDKEESKYTTNDYSNMLIKYSQEELNKMSFEELNNVYEEYGISLHQDLFNSLESTQNNMNEKTLPSIKIESDGEKQLYLTANEIIGTYIMVNSDVYATEHIVKLFGNSGLLNSEKINDNYLQTARIMNIYYSRATEKSGIINLFADEKDQELVNKFEDLIIAYNKATDKNAAGKELVSFYEELTDPAKIDNASKENPGAVSYILTVGLPVAMENRIIDEKTYLELINRNETITCDNLYNQVKNAESLSYEVFGENLTATGAYIIVFEEPRAMDEKNVKKLNRDLAGGNYSKFNSKYNTSGYKYSSTQRTQVSREQAVNKFGEETVRKAEETARQDVENQNAANAQYAAGLTAGYNFAYAAAYNQAASNGTQYSYSYASDGTPYNNGYSAGISQGLVAGHNAGMVEYNARLSAQPTTEQTEQPITQQPTTGTEQTEQPTEQQTEQTEQPVTEAQQPDTGEEQDPDFVAAAVDEAIPPVAATVPASVVNDLNPTTANENEALTRTRE